MRRFYFIVSSFLQYALTNIGRFVKILRREISILVKEGVKVEYRYKLKGVINLDEKSLTKYKTKILKIDGVSSISLDGEVAIISADAGAYEYDVLQTLIALSDEFGVEVVFGEDLADNGLIDGDLDETDNEIEAEYEEESYHEADDKKGKSSAKEQELVYNDGLKEARTALKKDTLFRIGELAVSLILYVASLFFKSTNSVLSVKMILVILSFSVSGYDIVFNAGVEIIKKKFLNGNLIFLLASIALIVLGEPNIATLVIWIFAVAKSVENYSISKYELKKQELFYVGTTALTVNGEEKARDKIENGDVIKLVQGDVVPTDGILNTEGEISSYKVNGDLNTTYNKNDKILAGSVVLSGELTYTATVNYGESYVDNLKLNYEEKVKNLGGIKCQKWQKIGLYADLLIILASLLIAFLLPITSSTYTGGLYKWGVIASVLLTLSCVTLSINNVINTYKNLYVEGLSSSIDYLSIDAINTIGQANSLKVSAKALCTFDKEVALKEDALGALQELTALGVKKVSTDFDCELPDNVKNSIDFIEPTLKGEKQFSFYEDKGDVSFSGDAVKVLNKELSFVPLAYKMAKKTKKSVSTSLVLGVVLRVIFIALAFVLPFSKFTVAYFAAGASALYLIQALLSLLGFTKNK